VPEIGIIHLVFFEDNKSLVLMGIPGLVGLEHAHAERHHPVLFRELVDLVLDLLRGPRFEDFQFFVDQSKSLLER
jgi:hypothetical protein